MEPAKTFIKVKRIEPAPTLDEQANKKERHKIAVKKYYEKHKEERYICEVCLGKITFSNKWNHKQSAIHMRHLEKQEAAKREAEAKAAAEKEAAATEQKQESDQIQE